jgi:hyperosmotically inducible periplasmic protein
MATPFSFAITLLAGLLTVAAVSAQTVDSATQHEAADNTKANAADRNTDAKTPLDQANDQDAIEVTAGIRRAVLEDSSLSTSAHNIKIVTNGNAVTLRGPVESADEKKRVESLAVKAAPGKQVRNELSIAR